MVAPLYAARVRFTTRQAEDYPPALLTLRKSPNPLWYAGSLPKPGQRGVAMVGSRAATKKGCEVAAEMAATIARRGLHVVSGGALGIDAAAHRGALQGGGTTFAVLGCGVDVVYPDRHRDLFSQIAAACGGLLSEYAPGTPPCRGKFPVRNRMVAALGEAVVVIEARPSSGALITARLGREQGRKVMAVPGSAGTDQLIASGRADPVLTGDDVLRRLAGEVVAGPARPHSLLPLLVALEGGGPATPAALSRQMELPLSRVLASLTEAELAGWVRRSAGGKYEVPRAN
jgi:DNA processing protein